MPRLSVLASAGIALQLVCAASLSPVGAADDTATFREAADRLMVCLNGQAKRSVIASETPLAYSDEVHRICGAEMSALIAFGSTPGERKRIRGAIRGTVTDAVLAYDARMSFVRR